MGSDMSPDSPGWPGRLAQWVLAHRGAVRAVTAVLVAFAGLAATRIVVDTDTLGLMPADEPYTRALLQLDEHDGGVYPLTITVRSDDAATRDTFLADLAGRVQQLPGVDEVVWQLDHELVRRLGWLQVPVADLVQLDLRLQGALKLGPAMANPMVAASLLDLGPLSKRLEATAAEHPWVSADDGLGRLIVLPNGSAHDLAFAEGLMLGVEMALRETEAQVPGVSVIWIGGAYRHNVEEFRGISSDIGRISVVGVGLVLLLVIAAYRSPRLVGVLVLPLIVANVLTLGGIALTVGSLNTFTSFAIAALFGLGVDFAIHLHARYEELLNESLAPEQAVITAWDRVANACLAAAATTAAGFGALWLARFDGFRQLGAILAVGVTITLAVTMILLPQLLVHLPRTHHAPDAPKPQGSRGRLGLAPPALLVSVLLTLAAATLIPQVRMEYDLSALRREGQAFDELGDQQQALIEQSYAPVVAVFPDLPTLRTAEQRITAELNAGTLPEFTVVLSEATLFPADVEARLAVLERLAAHAAHPNARWLPGPVGSRLAALVQTPPRAVSFEELPKAFQRLLRAPDGRPRLLLFPAGNLFDMRRCDGLVTAYERVLPGVQGAGEFLVVGILYRLITQDVGHIVAVAMLLVAVLVWFSLRSFVRTLVALGALAGGLAWTATVMVITDTPLSIVNFLGVPIVIGIGIDTTLHLVHRLVEEGPAGITTALRTTGRASLLSAATTVVAFLALMTAGSRGLATLGVLVTLGEVSVLVASFVFVPLGFATWWWWTGADGAAE